LEKTLEMGAIEPGGTKADIAVGAMSHVIPALAA
jgi:hypothetical protein